MELSEKIDSISEVNVVAEFNNMLDQAHITTSRWGQRLVSVDGYEGEVKLDKLASRYLDAVSYQRDHDTNLQSRLDCANLWDRVKALYIDSDSDSIDSESQLKKTLASRVTSRVVAPLLDLIHSVRICTGDPQAIIRWSKERDLQIFAFSPESFNKNLDKSMRIAKSCGVNPDDGTLDKTKAVWYSSKEMVESALARQR